MEFDPPQAFILGYLLGLRGEILTNIAFSVPNKRHLNYGMPTENQLEEIINAPLEPTKPTVREPDPEEDDPVGRLRVKRNTRDAEHLYQPGQHVKIQVTSLIKSWLEKPGKNKLIQGLGEMIKYSGKEIDDWYLCGRGYAKFELALCGSNKITQKELEERIWNKGETSKEISIAILSSMMKALRAKGTPIANVYGREFIEPENLKKIAEMIAGFAFPEHASLREICIAALMGRVVDIEVREGIEKVQVMPIGAPVIPPLIVFVTPADQSLLIKNPDNNKLIKGLMEMREHSGWARPELYRQGFIKFHEGLCKVAALRNSVPRISKEKLPSIINPEEPSGAILTHLITRLLIRGIPINNDAKPRSRNLLLVENPNLMAEMISRYAFPKNLARQELCTAVLMGKRVEIREISGPSNVQDRPDSFNLYGGDLFAKKPKSHRELYRSRNISPEDPRGR